VTGLARGVVIGVSRHALGRAGGVLEDASETVVAVDIAEGAHHLDLMFSHPSDNASLRAARRMEMQHVRRWVKQKNAASTRGQGREGLRVLGCVSSRRYGGGCALEAL